MNAATLQNSLVYSNKASYSGTNDSLSVNVGQNVQIVITANYGTDNGKKDWWAVLQRPNATWQHYNLASNIWQSGLTVSYQGVFTALGSTTIFSATNLLAGINTFYFGVDGVTNGTVDLTSLIYDTINVVVH